VATGERTLVKAGLSSFAINAIGYNAIDNKLYGVADTNPPTIIQIGSNGAVVTVRTIPSSSGTYNVGDVDENGDFWISASGSSWLKVNLSSGTITAVGTASIPNPVYDWAYVPGGGNFLYGIGISS
jgi:hypothetical protein